MPKERQPARDDRDGDARPADQGRRRGLRAVAAKPISWVVGVVVAALGIVLTNVIVSRITDVVEPALSTGAAIDVVAVSTFRSDTLGNSVVFPSGTSFDEAQIADLNRATDPTAWLESRGGVAPGTVFARVVLVGNRAGTVRVLDARAVPSCSDPLDGVLFLSPPAGQEDAVRLDFDLDNPGLGPTTPDGEGGSTPYFPAHSISLASDEQQVVIVTGSTAKSSCTFRVELEVLDGSETTTVTVPREDEVPLAVTAWVEEKQYEAVYLGGVVCSGGFVRANDAYFAGDVEHRCDG